MSHGDTILEVPNNFLNSLQVLKMLRLQRITYKGKKTLSEFNFTQKFIIALSEGLELLRKLYRPCLCFCQQNWTPSAFAETTIQELKDKIGNDKVVLGLMESVDSTVALLLHPSNRKKFVLHFVDNGLLRKTNLNLF